MTGWCQGEMGRGTPTCLMGLPNDGATVNGRDTLRHDLGGWGCNPTGSKLPNAENKFLHPKRQWWAAWGEPKSDRGKKRKSNDPLSVLPPETQTGLRHQRKVEAIGTRRFSVKEGRGRRQRPILGKAWAQLGRAIPDYFGSRNRCVLFRRFRWKSCTPPLECK